MAAVAMIGVSLAAPGLTQNSNTTSAYSAQAVHAFPGQPETIGKIVKSGAKLRLEFERDGEKVIQILLPELGAMYILNPAKQTYVEILGATMPLASIAGYVSPCPEQTQGTTCQKIGTDIVSGIEVERWILSTKTQNRPLVILWDSPRRRALRQDFPDGGSMTMAFKATEDLNGRATEHWTINLTLPGQDAQTGDWWFDPQLRVVVRETLPGGETRSLENIVIGRVDPSAFLIPEGWQEQRPPAITAPQPPPNVAPASE
ncbi:MAG: hypothetical protein COB40_12545 [Marinosulfonomonas sp.]|nr:MAG: hypothetical protein COB40_12545 [Marinosulfonomonas sp.]